MSEDLNERIAAKLYAEQIGGTPEFAVRAPFADYRGNLMSPEPLPLPPPAEPVVEEVDVPKLLAETVAQARLLVGEAGYPHHYLEDPDQQLRMAIFEMAPIDAAFCDTLVVQMENIFKWIKSGEVPSSQKKTGPLRSV